MRTITTTIDMEAPPARVWQVLTDFKSFPEWSTFVLSITGKAEINERLCVIIDDGKSKMTFKPKVVRCDASRELAWVGNLLGLPWLFCGEHFFRLEARSGQTTRLIHGEHFSGLLLPLLWSQLDVSTRAGFERFNAALRLRTESL